MEKKDSKWSPELWGGLECTINRLGDRYQDQLALTGHYERLDDIDHIAALGITKIRYPVLWERHEREYQCAIDWSWIEKQLLSLQQKNITVIAGLLHHGSGPRFTHLLDHDFPEHLAAYAFQVAKKFPWISYYTPINEPLTTARFSGLYGLWYPHHRNDNSFVRMMIHQVKGVILAMKAIRSINPEARLVQTEDLGKVHSTDTLQYQAQFENERRWLSFDLLHGKVTREHPLWDYLVSSGATENELQFFIDHPCQADIAGWNYYVTSERFLDEHVNEYPNHSIGGNEKHRYVDVEAVRVSRQDGLSALLKEASARVNVPFAITEAHICCTREEQMRWFMEIWSTCCALKEQGMNIEGVTAWALLGAYDWSSLLTRTDGIYEPGVFHVSYGILRQTALSDMLTSLATQGTYSHPLLKRKGWWHHDRKPLSEVSGLSHALLIIQDAESENVFTEICRQRNIDVAILTVDGNSRIENRNIENEITALNPWAILNLTDDHSIESILARFCGEHHIPWMFFSTMHDEGHALEKNAQIVRLKTKNPVDASDITFAQCVLDLLIDGHRGVWEITDGGQISSVQPQHRQINYSGWYQRVKDFMIQWTKGERFVYDKSADHIPQEESIENKN